MYLSDPTNQVAKMVHGEPDYDDDDMLPEMSQAEIDYRNKMAELQYANYLHEKQQKEFHYKGNLRNALLSLSNKLRDYVDAFSAIPELSAAVMRWKAAATAEERLQYADWENGIIMQVHDIQRRGLRLPT